MLYLLWPNFGHMTDTGECEGQIGCLAPEVRRESNPHPTPLPWKTHRLPVSSQMELLFLPAETGETLYPPQTPKDP